MGHRFDPVGDKFIHCVDVSEDPQGNVRETTMFPRDVSSCADSESFVSAATYVIVSSVIVILILLFFSF